MSINLLIAQNACDLSIVRTDKKLYTNSLYNINTAWILHIKYKNVFLEAQIKVYVSFDTQNTKEVHFKKTEKALNGKHK
jgi:hypothetical protein